MPYYPEKKPKPSGEEQKQTKMTEKQIRLLRLSVAVFSCFLILYGSVRLILYYADLSASRNTARELQQIHNQEEPETEFCSQDTGTDRASIVLHHFQTELKTTLDKRSVNILITKGCIGRRIGILQRIRVTSWNQAHINYTKCVNSDRVGIRTRSKKPFAVKTTLRTNLSKQKHMSILVEACIYMWCML